MSPFYATATELLGRLDRGEVSSAELLEVLLDRVERVDADVNAMITVDADGARERARAADEERARGELRGPLHGLPMTIKDCFETEGIRTTAGAPFLAGHVPQLDADAVARLRGAGANVFAKTNVPFLTADGQAYNEVCGNDQQPLGPGAHAGRLLGWCRGGARGRDDPAGPGQRHRGLDPDPRLLLGGLTVTSPPTG